MQNRQEFFKHTLSIADNYFLCFENDFMNKKNICYANWYSNYFYKIILSYSEGQYNIIYEIIEAKTGKEKRIIIPFSYDIIKPKNPDEFKTFVSWVE